MHERILTGFLEAFVQTQPTYPYAMRKACIMKNPHLAIASPRNIEATGMFYHPSAQLNFKSGHIDDELERKC